ncbi:hypothetical protein CY35_16G056900 [Sphagnum magellanicum]|nr:hypothetical protein CY35_16G056900 [Sphagnum magellanicum]
MGIVVRYLLMLAAASFLAVATALPSQYSDFKLEEYNFTDVITRDVCIIGGGSSGTYAAIRLRDLGKSVVVVEHKDRMGGHTQTYTDPQTGRTVDFGVQAFHNLDIVKNYFKRFSIPLVTMNFSSPGVTSTYVDLSTGKEVAGYVPSDPRAALAGYVAQLAKYPYVETGFNLTYPVPEDLLLPFGDFVTKYSLQGVVQLIFEYAEVADLLNLSTLYVFKAFGSDLIRDLEIGFLTTARHDNSELYEKATTELGQDVLLKSYTVAMDRDAAGAYAKVVVKTPDGLKLIQAKKILLTIPPKLYNLVGWDLSSNETSLFAQFRNVGYYISLLRHTGIPDNVKISNVGTDTPYNLPILPGAYVIEPTAVPGLHTVYFGSDHPLPDAEVEAAIIGSISRLGTAGTLPTTAPYLAIFSSHTPYELRVPSKAIKDGFYKELYGLQGQRRTYYTGAAFHTHDSSLLWQFTETLLQLVVA